MAEQTATKTCSENNYNITAKLQDLLARFSSTVFTCDTSGDTRYIKCDFPQCRQHAEALQGKPCWILNTLRNVRVLESHVDKEVHHYMKEIDSRTDDQVAKRHYVDSQHWIEAQGLPEGTRKVLAVFNLKDPQSQFGDWISLFLKAAFMAEGLPQHGCVVITQNFVSRHELMECIAKLNFLNSHRPTVEVVAVLSCHSSCQGQVFSCTPFAIGKQSGFEEFCSLHDFVMACQSVLKDVLMAVHISSCFTLKLDCSHADWPVDADWLKTKLQCILCGSTKEVYETGSQVADLHLMLSTALPSSTAGTCGTQLREAVYRACVEGFPDLAREMGLEVLDPDTVDDRLSREGTEDQVTPPGLVMSSVRVVLLVQDESPSTPSKHSDETRDCGSYVALADAVVANLQIRKASDVKFEYIILQMKQDETRVLKESLKKHLNLLPCDSFKVLFIAIGRMFSRPNVELVDLIKEWNTQRTGDICYGVHFQHVTAMQAYVIKNRLKEIQHAHVAGNGTEKRPSARHLAVTGLVDNGNRNCSASFPVLLYMIHLAVGENGNRLAGKGIPSAMYSNKPVGHGMSSWTLEEVYMETCHVLSGLSRKCGLHLLSVASNTFRPASTISTCPTSVYAMSSEAKTLESVCDEDKHSGLVSAEKASGEVGPSSVTKVAGATAEEGNTLELAHEEAGSSAVSNFISTGYDDALSTMFHNEPPSTFSSVLTDPTSSLGNGSKPFLGNEKAGRVTVVTEASLPERDGNSEVSSCDDKVFPTNEESDNVTCGEKTSLTISALVDYSSSSEDEGKLIHDDDDYDEPVGLACLQKESLTIGAFLDEARFPEEDRVTSITSEIVHDEEGVLRESLGVSCCLKPSLTTCSAITDLSASQEERSALKLDSEGQVGSACLKNELSTVSPVLKGATLSDGGGSLNMDSYEQRSHTEPVETEFASGNPVLEGFILPVEEAHTKQLDQDESGLLKEPVGFMSLEKDSSNISRVNEEAVGLVCLETALSTTPVVDDAPLLAEGEDSVNLDHGGDGLDGKAVKLACLKKESSTTGVVLEDECLPEEKSITMNLDQDDEELEKKPVGAICEEKPSSAFSEGFSESGESLHDDEYECYVPCESDDKVDDTGLIGSSSEKSEVKSSSIPQNVTGTKKTLFQTWLQNFTKYCEDQKQSIEGRESSQDPPSKRRKKNVPTSTERNCMSGNLESKNKCLGVTKGSFEVRIVKETGCVSELSSSTSSSFVSEMSSSTSSSCVSELSSSTASSSGEHVVTSHHVESETESDSATNVETAEFKSTNLLEILGDKEANIDSENSSGRKRPLLIDYSSNEESSAKKPMIESECVSQSETTVDESLNTASNAWNNSDDLPLMANVDEVLVNHYILDLSVEFSEKIMKGSIVLFLEPRNEEVTKRQFQLTLDSTLVNIESVSEVVLPQDFKLTFFGDEQNIPSTQEASSSGVFNGFLGNILGDNTQKPLPFKGLPYSVYGWFVRIWKPGATGKAWPRCIWIKYHTSPEGKSLTWATDQDGKPCVYSPGAYINNRSLMPCQEPPVAMSTWQASIHVPEGCVVLMSGNELVGKTAASSNHQVTYLYEMGTPLPCSTLAVAVGWWLCRQSRNADTKDGANPNVLVACRLFAPPSLIDKAADELLGYAPKFLEASCELLGPYPFRRLDMLILPKCFACMGLKSPNLVFLSQSLLSGDASMRVRLAHEISHAWFGLLVGSKDWSEEWLSEGFATFIEEKIQSRAEKWSKDKDRFYREIRQILRHRCLLSEIKECDANLKYLRPKVVKPSTALSTAEAIQKSTSEPDAVRPHTVVQFGQICSRKWTQVHYLKGYFLLHHLASMVGLEEFDAFLFSYVQHYKEQLVSSEDFFEFFVQSFPDVSRETKDKFIREWLERAGLPKSFPKRFDSPDNELVSQVEQQFQIWKKQDTTNKRNKTLKVRKRTKPPTSTLEFPEQVVLFLEKLLERETLSHNTLRQLDKCYNFSNGNAEIRHRWCELVVKHKYIPGLPEVKRFLVEDQGMGIYLFGELIISQQPKQRALVDEVLEEISTEMDRCTYQTVKDMLEGNE